MGLVSLIMPPVRGDTQGGNMISLPGAALSIRGEKSIKTTPNGAGRGGLSFDGRRALFFCVHSLTRQKGHFTVSKRCLFRGFYRLYAAIVKAAMVLYHRARVCETVGKRYQYRLLPKLDIKCFAYSVRNLL
jgi:hypothetical protein